VRLVVLAAIVAMGFVLAHLTSASTTNVHRIAPGGGGSIIAREGAKANDRPNNSVLQTVAVTSSSADDAVAARWW
jgi:hypothetical protein